MSVIHRMGGSSIVLLSFTFKSFITDVCFSFSARVRSEQVSARRDRLKRVLVFWFESVFFFFHFLLKAFSKNDTQD